jgi:F-box-like
MITYLCWIGRLSPPVTIGALPDNVLLNIFDYCREAEMVHLWLWPRAWLTLVHVCQRWRYIILESPRRLNLYILCTYATPVRDMLNIWPPFPIQITSHGFGVGDNIIAALEHRDRVCAISLDLTDSPWEWEGIAKVMLQERFPALTYLHLQSYGETLPALPDTFLQGSAPRLRRILLRHILFPALPKLLLSCVDLYELYLYRIPEYVSPEAMVTSLAALTRLGFLSLEFESSGSNPHKTRLPPPFTRTEIPSLTYLRFQGVSEYLEDLVARIDAPKLQHLKISLYNPWQLLFDIRQLARFICRLEVLSSPNYAEVTFSNYRVKTILYQLGGTNPPQKLELEIKSWDFDRQLSSIVQLWNQSLSLLSCVEQLDVLDSRNYPALQGIMDNTQWLDLFRPFTAVRILRISHKMRRHIVSALQEFSGNMATEVLPALGSLYLEGYEPLGPVRRAIEPYITARQVSNHPVTIHHWEASQVD